MTKRPHHLDVTFGQWCRINRAWAASGNNRQLIRVPYTRLDPWHVQVDSYPKAELEPDAAQDLADEWLARMALRMNAATRSGRQDALKHVIATVDERRLRLRRADVIELLSIAEQYMDDVTVAVQPTRADWHRYTITRYPAGGETGV